jgi:hypothetical protein
VIVRVVDELTLFAEPVQLEHGCAARLVELPQPACAMRIGAAGDAKGRGA